MLINFAVRHGERNKRWPNKTMKQFNAISLKKPQIQISIHTSPENTFSLASAKSVTRYSGEHLGMSISPALDNPTETNKQLAPLRDIRESFAGATNITFGIKLLTEATFRPKGKHSDSKTSDNYIKWTRSHSTQGHSRSATFPASFGKSFPDSIKTYCNSFPFCCSLNHLLNQTEATILWRRKRKYFRCIHTSQFSKKHIRGTIQKLKFACRRRTAEQVIKNSVP